jgi:bifunctional DNase/RNase
MAGDGGAGPARSLDGADVPGEAPAAPADVPNERRTEDGQTGDRQAEERQADERQPEPPGGTEQESAYPLSPPAEEAPSEPQPMRQAAFMGVALELPSVHPAVVLQEIDAPMRELRVTIAQPEGVAIAYAWRGIATPRPLTHDLLTSILQRFGLQVDAVRITGVDGPVFHAELALSGPTGSHTVECRPSDALALALRQPLPVPIMVAEEVLVTAGRSLGA